ncbi:MAG: GTP-binding protein [Pseudomonadota bacterium]
MDPIPVTVIGGYLGAGKTSLVNHLLRTADGLRLAVLVNEFGELPIDADLIEAEGDDVIAIAGGCVCCSYGDDLARALIDMARMDPRPDHVLIECSGVAIPSAVTGALTLQADYQPDGVAVLVDAETAQANAADVYVGDTVRRQFAEADLLLLNKIDLVSGDAIDALAAWLGEQAPGASLLKIVEGRAPRESVVGAALGREAPAAPPPRHGDVFETVAFAPPGPVDPEALARALAEAPGLVRAKGFVEAQDGVCWRIQIVGSRSRVERAPAGSVVGLVAIGAKAAFDPRAALAAAEAAAV